MALVRVIVVNYSSGDMLRRCLLGLINQTENRFEIIVVDNGSTDASLDNLPDDPRIKILQIGQNIGFAAANNLGFEGCQSPFVAFLNPDAIPKDGWLAALLRAAERFPGAAMFGSLQLQHDNPNLLDGAGDVYHCTGTAWRGGYSSAAPTQIPSGEAFAPCAAAAMYRSTWFQKVNGFDERYFCYYEDIDLAFRVRLLGGRCFQVEDAVVYHVGSAVTGAASPFTVYHLNRNQVWTFVKCMPGPLFWLLLPLHLLFILLSLLRGSGGPTSNAMRQGLRDSLGGLPDVWRQRRHLQAGRCISWITIARALAWSPFAISKRPIDIRSWREN